jgi:hypothetical protein
VANTSVASDFYQPLYVKRYLSAQITFHYLLFVNDIAYARHFIIGEITHSRVRADVGRSQYPVGSGAPYPINVR